MTKDRKKVVVGMSGGVDSSVSLLLLKKAGFEPVGVSLKYDIWKDRANQLTENVCCSDESFEIARHVCEKIGCEYHILDTGKIFRDEIVGYFKRELKNKRTPNPCVVCNRVLKFRELFDFADQHNIYYVATGHYARVMANEKTGDYELHRGKDEKKDQTYTLSFLKKEMLSRILFPLGDYTKNEIMEIAKKAGFSFYEKRKESQDFCFISPKAMNAYLEKEIGVEEGEIENTSGQKVGHHRGIHFYTVGQRKGLDVPNGPNFVVDADVSKNKLIVTNDAESPYLYKSEIILSPYNLFVPDPPKKGIKLEAKIRYQQNISPATLFKEEGQKLKIIFDHPQKAVTKGQYAVFYQGSRCLGSGRIIETIA